MMNWAGAYVSSLAAFKGFMMKKKDKVNLFPGPLRDIVYDKHGNTHSCMLTHQPCYTSAKQDTEERTGMMRIRIGKMNALRFSTSRSSKRLSLLEWECFQVPWSCSGTQRLEAFVCLKTLEKT